ncbi:MAG: hypothetical protein ABIO79_10920 [Ferruginibacter sp.]
MLEKNNFYASFSNVDKEYIKKAFEKEGWNLRKASWTDYELSNRWSELILEGENDSPLLNGAIYFCQENLEILDKIFMSLKGEFQYEFYDENKNLILQKNNGS